MSSLFDPEGTLPRISAGNGMKWVPIWDMTDEFWRGNLHTIWEPYNKTWCGRPPGFFKDSNISVTNHSLLLKAQEDQPQYLTNIGLRSKIERVNAGIRQRSLLQPQVTPVYNFRDFSTSFVRTKKRQKYGYFEISCKLADSEISSAFWLAYNEENRDRPGSWWTEIDVFEYSTTRQKVDSRGIIIYQERMINTNTHVHRFGNDYRLHHQSNPKIHYENENLSKRPHKFGLDWTKDHIAWYFDDKLIRTEKNKYFHRELHLQFDRETFPNWFGLPGTGGRHRNNLPNNFEIYYVRSWDRYV